MLVRVSRQVNPLHRSAVRAAAVTLGILAFLTQATAGDEGHPDRWTRFRGPDGTGHAPLAGDATPSRLPKKLTPEGFDWRVELVGRGHSSPVVWDGLVFVTCELDDGQRLLCCHDAEDGAILWTAEDRFQGHGQHRLNSFAASTPALDSDRVYVTWTSGDKVLAQAWNHDGDELWRRELGSFGAQHGSGISPIVVGDTLIVGNDHEAPGSFLIGLDPADGSTRWKRDRTSSRAAYSTPIVHRSGGDVQVLFSSTSHGVTSLDPTDGSIHWEVDGLFEQRCVGCPVIAGDLVFCTAGSGNGGKESVAIRMPGENRDAEVAYRLRRALPYVPSPIAHGEWLFLWADGGVVSCVQAATGEEVWRERVEGNFFSSPILVGDRLYAISMDGQLVVVRATNTFELCDRVDLGEPSEATPAFAGGRLFLRTERHLIAIGSDSGDA